MKIKIYILILFVFFITGCTVNYDIEVTSDSIKELVQINENIDNINANVLNSGILSYKNAIDNIYDLPQNVYIDADRNLYDLTQELEGVDYYSKKFNITEENYGLEASFEHLINNYQKATTINKCYKNIAVLKKNDNLTISTSRNNLCFEQYKSLDKLNIIVTINEKEYAVISSNADKIEEGKYYWEINRENYSNKSILIELEALEEVRKKQNDMYFLIGFMVVVSIIILLVYLFIKRRSEDTNKI